MDDTRSVTGSEIGDNLRWIPHATQVWAVASVSPAVKGKVKCEIIDLTGADDSPGEVITLHEDELEESSTHVEEAHVQMDVTDICQLYLSTTHEGPALNFIKNMYSKGGVYINVAGLLVAVNPQSPQPALYDKAMRFCVEDTYDLPAHIFKMCNKVIRTLFSRNLGNTSVDTLNQSIIMNGDSGSGKTETAQHASHWIVRASPIINDDSVDSEAGKRALLLRDVIRESNLVFASFGNAKTKFNDNSSRFGKYVKLQFTESNKLVSVYNETFLLEKSRLLTVTPGERSYHIFYQLFRGMGSAYPDLKKKLNLHAVEQFRMLTNGNCLYRQHVQEDVAGFHATVKALVSLGTSDEELKALWTLLAVMLHLGNANFEQEEADDLCRIVIDTMSMNDLADLLGVSAEVFTSAMTTQSVANASPPKSPRGTLSGTTVRNLSKEDVQINIHGFLKHIYKGIYFWLVRKTNHAGAYSGNILGLPVKFVGIMDLYGFEDKGATNSLEQLCINMSEERLKQQFTERIFVQDAHLYAAEGIDCDFIQYTDNQNIIDCITKKPSGLLPSLDSATHEKMEQTAKLMGVYSDLITNSINSATSTPIKAGSKILPTSPIQFANQNAESFVVNHFSGDVTYHLEDFLQKNIDASSVDLMGLLSSSTNTYLKATLGIGNMVTEGEIGYIPWLNNPLVMPQSISALKTKSIAGSGTATVTSLFTSQLDTMMSNLRNTSSHYVKCIRPNARTPQEEKGKFDARVVNQQLLCHGIHETVTLTKIGFPERMEFREFYSHFEMLKVGSDWAAPFECSESQAKEYAETIAMNLLDPSSFKSGRTLMFLQDGVTEFLENTILDLMNANASLIQSHWKRYVTRRFYLVAVVAWRQKKATAEFAKSLFNEKNGDRTSLAAVRMQHNVQIDVFSAINTMSTKTRRPTSPANTGASLANIFSPIGTDDNNEDSEHIKRLQDYYLGKMEIIKSFLRTMIITRRVSLLFRAVESGDSETVMTMLRRRPELLKALDKANDFMSLQQAALKVGNADMVRLLGLTPLSVVLKDAGDNSCAHYAAIRPNLMMYKLFYKTVSTMFAFPKEAAVYNSAQKASSVLPASSGGLHVNALGLSSHATSTRPVLRDSGEVSHAKKTGYLYKLNNSGRLARRFCSLEKNRFKYWYTMPEKDSQDVEYHVDEFRITRQDCFFSRYNSERGYMLFVMNFSAPSARKRRKKIIFKANNEIDLQSWMYTLSQVASFDRFRSYSPRFRNPQFCRVWLSQVTWARETALHTLVHASNSALCRSRRACYADNIHATHNDAAAITDALTCAAWLIEHGCPVNQKNYEGETALHLAVAGGNVPMALCLVRKGAALEVKDFQAKLPTDLCDALTPETLGFPGESGLKGEGEKSEADDASPTAAAGADKKDTKKKMNADAIALKAVDIGRNLKYHLRLENKEYFRLQMPTKDTRLLPSPLTANIGLRTPTNTHSMPSAQKKGYSFMSMFVQKQTVDVTEFMSADRLADQENFKNVIRSGRACLQMGLYNGNTHQLMEPLQECEKPIFMDANGALIWWGFTYYVQTPLEFFPDMSFVNFRLYMKDLDDREVKQRDGKPVKVERAREYEEEGDSDDDTRSQTSEASAMKSGHTSYIPQLVDVEVSIASYFIDKSVVDTGAIRVNLRDVKSEGRNIPNRRGGSNAEESEEKADPRKGLSLKGFKKGGSSQSTLDLDIELSEYFEPITVKDVLLRKTDFVSNYAQGCYVNNPTHLSGAGHDKTQNKIKRGIQKPTPVIFSLSYFEGAASQRLHFTLPQHVKGGDLIRDVGGHKHLAIVVPGHVRGGQNVILEIPTYSKLSEIAGLPEVKVDDFNPNRADVVHMKYILPRGVTSGPFIVQNTDGSRRLQLQIPDAIIVSFNDLDEKAPGLPIVITFNSTISLGAGRPRMDSTHVHTNLHKSGIGNVFSGILGTGGDNDSDRSSEENESSGEEDSEEEDEEKSSVGDMYDAYDKPPVVVSSRANPMRSFAKK